MNSGSSRKTKRLSGAEYKKKKMKKDEEKKMLSGSLDRLFSSVTSRNSNNDDSVELKENISVEPERLEAIPSCSGSGGSNQPSANVMNIDSNNMALEHDGNECEMIQNSSSSDGEITLAHEGSDIEGQHDVSTTVDLQQIGDDPGLWTFPLLAKDRNYLAKKGPVQIEDYDFPVNEDGRKFSTHFYLRTLANREKVKRDWLIYSKSLDSVFCFSCRLFNTSSKYYALFDKNGFCDWRHLTRTILNHEVTQMHILSYSAWKRVQHSFDTGNTIDAAEQRLFTSAKQQWEQVLKRLISITLFLAGQNLAFRGSSDKLYAHNNGNFLKTVELMAQYDPIIQEHVNKIQKNPNLMSHYLGHVIQNELIEIIADVVKSTILSDIKKAKYYALILDCTPDKNKVEQLTLVIRYLNLEKMAVHEAFIEFIPIISTTGKNITDVILTKLEVLGLHITNMRGQSYDNGANMRGKHVGVQKRILDLNPRAAFVPCAAHTLNLVVNDAAKSTLDSVNFFSTVHAIYIFFAASTQRWAILKNKVQYLTLKPLSETRWESRVDSIKALKYQIGEIYDVLIEVSNRNDVEVSVRNEADALAKKIKSFSFCVCVVIWYEILNSVNTVSKMLQDPTINVSDSGKTLAKLLDHFRGLRTDEAFESFLVDATPLADELEIPSIFSQEVRARPRKRQFIYECADEPISDSKSKFKIEIFFVVLDRTIQAIEERFELLKSHLDQFSFLYNISLLENVSKEDITKHCMDLEIFLTDGEEKDIFGIELRDEILSLIAITSDLNSPLATFKYIVAHGLEATTPNLFVAFRILITLPVSVASGERSFSKLKIIENYLRTCMLQERLNSLSLISIEHDIAAQLDYSDIISRFAEKKARRYH